MNFVCSLFYRSITTKSFIRGFGGSMAPRTSNMFKYQELLPRFPLPKLEDTLAKYKETSKPLLSTEEWQKFSKTVDEFQATDGIELQRLLTELDKEAPYNWMEGYWQSMYLDLRCPMPVNVNPFLILGDDPNPKRNSSQVLRAASLTAAAARFFIQIQREELEPDMAGDAPLCMNGFTQIAGTRIPKVGRDEFVVAKNARHIAVLCRNQPYRLNVINKDGSIIHEPELARQFQAIVEHANSLQPKRDSLGFLTTENRDTWALAKNKLAAVSAENKENLEEIDSSLFVVCLDDTKPKDLVEFSKSTLYGNAANRYYDKLELIVTQDGQASFNMEHTGYDGQVITKLIFDIYNDAVSKPLEPVSFTDPVLPKPHYLSITYTPEISAIITKAESNWNEFVAINDLTILNFDEYGKSKIKQFKLPPDAYFQTAAQIATKRTYGKFVSTYESSSVRNFSHGRTETIRPLTVSMRDFVEKFEDPNVPESAKFEAIHKAAKGHQTVVKASKVGEGIDRHLQGLYWTSLQKAWRIYQFKIPKFFTDGTYSNYMANILSTSNVGGDFKAVKLFGFGAVHGDGVGLGYLVNSDSLVMVITSYTGKAEIWKENMRKALKDMKKLLEDKTPPK